MNSGAVFVVDCAHHSVMSQDQHSLVMLLLLLLLPVAR